MLIVLPVWTFLFRVGAQGLFETELREVVDLVYVPLT